MRGDFNRALAVISNVTPLVTADIAASPANSWTDGAVVDAHIYAGWTYDYYFKRFGRRGLDNANRTVLNITHLVKRPDIFTAPADVVGEFYLNAFYCGDCAGGVMVYGEGLPGGVSPSDTGQRWDCVSGRRCRRARADAQRPDFSSRLGVNESDALNKSFSDMMGSVEFYFNRPGRVDEPTT